VSSAIDLPVIDYFRVAEQSMSLPAVRALVFGSYGVVALGVMYRYAKEMLKPVAEANFAMPFVVGAFWFAVLFGYSNLTTKVINVVTHLGDASYANNAEDLQAAFVGRISTFLSDLKSTQRKSNTSGQLQLAPGAGGNTAPYATIPDPTPSTGGFAKEIGVVLLQVIVWICYLLVVIVVFLLRAIQMYMLGIIAAYGPILLAFASLGGIFHPLGLAWFWGLVEVSAWTITYSILFRFISSIVPERAPDSVNFATEIILCAVLVYLFRAVPKVTAMLLRNESAAGLAMGATEMRLAQVAATARSAWSGGGAGVRGGRAIGGAAKKLWRRFRR
jgi:hypothetical protein